MKKLLIAALCAVTPFASAGDAGNAPVATTKSYDLVFQLTQKEGLALESRRALSEMRPSFYSSCTETPAGTKTAASKSCESVQFQVTEITTRSGSDVVEAMLKVEMWSTVDNIVTKRRTLESRGLLVPDRPWVQSDSNGSLAVYLKPSGAS